MRGLVNRIFITLGHPTRDTTPPHIGMRDLGIGYPPFSHGVLPTSLSYVENTNFAKITGTLFASRYSTLTPKHHSTLDYGEICHFRVKITKFTFITPAPFPTLPECIPPLETWKTTTIDFDPKIDDFSLITTHYQTSLQSLEYHFPHCTRVLVVSNSEKPLPSILWSKSVIFP